MYDKDGNLSSNQYIVYMYTLHYCILDILILQVSEEYKSPPLLIRLPENYPFTMCSTI